MLLMLWDATSGVTVGKLVSQLVGLLAAGCRTSLGSNHLQTDTKIFCKSYQLKLDSSCLHPVGSIYLHLCLLAPASGCVEVLQWLDDGFGQDDEIGEDRLTFFFLHFSIKQTTNAHTNSDSDMFLVLSTLSLWSRCLSPPTCSRVLLSCCPAMSVEWCCRIDTVICWL